MYIHTCLYMSSTVEEGKHTNIRPDAQQTPAHGDQGALAAAAPAGREVRVVRVKRAAVEVAVRFEGLETSYLSDFSFPSPNIDRYRR